MTRAGLPVAASTPPGRLVRRADESAVWGVCGALARAPGRDVALVRIVALMSVALGGLGAVAYVAAAAGTPAASAADARVLRRPTGMAVGTALVAAMTLALVAHAGLLVPVRILGILAAVGAGAALIWQRTGGDWTWRGTASGSPVRCGRWRA